MQKHLVHFVLIILLAVAPMQSVLAGLAALQHSSSCAMGNGHAGESHSAMPDKGGDTKEKKCDCCGDCLTTCVSLAKPTIALGSEEFTTQQMTELNTPRYTLIASSQYPPADIRPPKVLH